MTAPPATQPQAGLRHRAGRVVLFGLIVIAQFCVFEAGLRTWGHSEAAPAFQGLFDNDPVIGYRLKPNARTRFTTAEFSTDIRINNVGVRDDEDIGPKSAGEKRIVLLGDSLVLSVQVPFNETFGELLEADLNRRSGGPRYRVINAGVQGYGPVEEMLFFQRLAERLEPDLVITVVFVGNDAEEAYGSRRKLDPNAAPAARVISESILTRLRRTVRRSMVLQILRLRVLNATERFRNAAPPEPPLQTYAANPAPRIAEGLTLTRHALETITHDAADLGAKSAVVLMPARFQVSDEDYGNLRDAVRSTGGELIRDAGTKRFDETLASMPVSRFDVLPALRAALPGSDLFFRTTVHLTTRGHQVVAGALADFIRSQRLLESANQAVH
jgi:lysophospholipase L1-like esterase